MPPTRSSDGVERPTYGGAVILEQAPSATCRAGESPHRLVGRARADLKITGTVRKRVPRRLQKTQGDRDVHPVLATVSTHQATFFRSGWAYYDTARPGTLRRVPSDARIGDLRADDRAMLPVMFDDRPPAANGILEMIKQLPDAIDSV